MDRWYDLDPEDAAGLIVAGVEEHLAFLVESGRLELPPATFPACECGQPGCPEAY